MSLPFVLLALAVAAVWLPTLRVGGMSIPAWGLLFAAAVVSAAADGLLRPAAIGVLAALCALAWGARHARGPARSALVVATALLALVVSLHLVPGFVRPAAIDFGRTSPDAVPFALGLSFDKAAAGLVLLATFCLARRGDGCRGPGRARRSCARSSRWSACPPSCSDWASRWA